jgi:hypothetical protein
MLIAKSIVEETGGGDEAFRAHSLLYLAGNVKATAHGGSARAIIYPAYGHQIPVAARDKDIDPFIDSVLSR